MEGDQATAMTIQAKLKASGIYAYTTDLPEEGIDLAKLYDYDIILLDINSPDMPDLQVLKTLRRSKVDTPVFILSDTHDTETKVLALGAGADDFVTKPFNGEELIARIRAVVRRSKGHSQSRITTGAITVNLDEKSVEVAEQRVHLTKKEYQMLELLSLTEGLDPNKRGLSEPPLWRLG